jgi:hypothetical protein
MHSVTAGFYFYQENKTVEVPKIEASIPAADKKIQAADTSTHEEQTAKPQNKKAEVEMVKISFDNRPWKEGYRDINAQAQLIEYVLSNQTIDNWSELVTVQCFPGIRNTKQLFEDAKQKAKQDGIKSDFKLVKLTEREVVYTWYVADQPKKGIPA